MATTNTRRGVPSQQQLRLAYILSVVPPQATAEEFRDIKAKHGPLFDDAMNSERAEGWAEAIEYLEGIGGADLETLEVAKAANPYSTEGDSDD